MSPSWSSGLRGLRWRSMGWRGVAARFPFHRVYRVHLAADALMACEVQSLRGSRRVVRKARFPFAPGGRAGAMEVLREWMGGSPVRGSFQEWVLGASAVRYLLLPWAPDLVDRTLRESMAMALFEQQFGHDPQDCAIRFAGLAYGQGLLAAFVAHDLLDEINAHARISRCRLVSAVPSVATVWDRFRKLLATESGVMCLADGDRQVVLHHARGRIGEVALRPFDAERCAAMPMPMGMVDARWRVFSSMPIRNLPPNVLLALPDGEGFLPAQDAAFAFALCGVF